LRRIIAFDPPIAAAMRLPPSVEMMSTSSSSKISQSS